jgi:single-strand DNA-binding protein
MVKFSLATTEQWKDKTTGEKQESTQWHRCTAFGKLAEIIAEYCTKGMLIDVEGQLRYRTVGEGDSRTTYAGIRVNEMRILSRPSGSEQRSKQDTSEPITTEEEKGDALPF